jgi:sirohydrochlorin cobaltochelatase
MNQEQTAALVLLAHGSRDPRWAQPLAALQEELRRQDPSLQIELAFLELQPPGLAQVLESLAGEGARRIQVAPVFWSMGGHATRDLPAVVQAFRQQHPEVAVTVLPVLAELPHMNEFLVGALLAAGNDRVGE